MGEESEVGGGGGGVTNENLLLLRLIRCGWGRQGILIGKHSSHTAVQLFV